MNEHILSVEMIELIDKAIDKGIARSRSDLIREAVIFYLRELGMFHQKEKKQMTEEEIKKMIIDTIREVFESRK